MKFQVCEWHQTLHTCTTSAGYVQKICVVIGIYSALYLFSEQNVYNEHVFAETYNTRYILKTPNAISKHKSQYAIILHHKCVKNVISQVVFFVLVSHFNRSINRYKHDKSYYKQYDI